MADPTDIWVYPRWPALTADMIFLPTWPIAPIPHYVSLAQLAAYINPAGSTAGPGEVLGNPTAVAGPAISTSLSSIIDRGIGAVQGSVLYRGATSWLALPPGAADYVLATRGAGADPRWAALSTLPGGGAGGGTSTGNTPPGSPTNGTLWWDSVGGQLYVWYDDGTSAQWVAATNEQGSAGSGGTGLPSGVTYDQLVYLGGSWAGYRPRYIISCFVPGVLTANQYLLVHRFSKAVTIAANFGPYLGHTSSAAGTVSASQPVTTIDIMKATVAAPGVFSAVGSIAIAGGSRIGSLSTVGGTALSFAQNDSIAIIASATPDTSFANFSATLVGYEA